MEIKFYLLVSISIVTFLVLYLTGQFVLRFWIQPRFLGLFFRGKRGFNEYCTINKFQNFDCKSNYSHVCWILSIQRSLGFPYFSPANRYNMVCIFRERFFKLNWKFSLRKKKRNHEFQLFFSQSKIVKKNLPKKKNFKNC